MIMMMINDDLYDANDIENGNDNDDDCDQDVDVESIVVKMSPTKDINSTVIEIINRSLGEGLGDGGSKHFNVKFMTNWELSI